MPGALGGGGAQDAVRDALGAGIDSFTQEDRKAVREARESVHLSQTVAKQIVADTARQ